MADTIKGLTVKIGADTSDFVKELKKVDKEINTTQKTATELQKGLALEFDSARFTQAQKQAQNALKLTEEKAQAIRSQLKYLEDTGGVDTDGYVKLEQELAKTETRALKVKEQLETINKLKFDDAMKGITSLSSGLDKAAKSTAALSLAAVGAIAGIYKMAGDAAFAGAEIQDMADQLGIAAEEIQRFDYYALQSGLETEELVKGIAKVRDAIGTGLAGETNAAVDVLQNLFGSLESIPTESEDAFMAIVEELGKIEDSTMQAYYANELFGERLATSIIPLLGTGAERFAELNAEFEAIGYLSNEQVQALADFDDELNIMKERMELVRIELGIALIPILQVFVDLLENNIVPAIKAVAEWFESLSSPMQNLIAGSLLLVAALSPVLFILSKVVGVIPTVIKAITALNSTVGSLAIGFGAAFAAIGLVVGLVSNWVNMGAIEQAIAIIGTLTAAVLGAAVAFGVFHSTWSLGLAVAGIVAGIVAATAAINTAKQDIEVPSNIPDYNANDYSGIASGNYNVPSSSSGTSGSYSEDNSQYNINIELSGSNSESYDAKLLANEVIKEIVLAKQARGV